MGCRRPATAPNTTGSDASSEFPASTQHRPEAKDLAQFLRGRLSPLVRLVELKSDPPASLLGASSDSGTWSYNVRVTLAPSEDVLCPPTSEEAASFQSMVDELNTLAAWSQAYARSPYAKRYPGFAVDTPDPARPKLLAIAHPKDKPFAPLYGKMSAEWQVDHWNYEVVALQDPPDQSGKPRSQYPEPILIRGSPEAIRFVERVKTSLDAARSMKTAIDAAYRADLLKATQPRTVYRGQLTHGKNVLTAEAHLLAAAPGDEPNMARLEFRLPSAGYTYLCSVRLSASPPVQQAASNDEAEDQGRLSNNSGKLTVKADLAVGYLRVTDPKSSRAGTPASDFRSATMSTGVDDKFWLSVRDGRLAGKMTLYDFDPPYFFDGQVVP